MSIFEFTPHFDHQKIRITHEKLIGIGRPFVFHSELAVGDFDKICFVVRAVEMIQILSCIFFYPNRIQCLCKRFGQNGLSGAFRTDNTDSANVLASTRRIHRSNAGKAQISTHARLLISRRETLSFRFQRPTHVKRRQAIRQLGVGISSAVVTSWLASCDKNDPAPEIQYDGTVAIIGAGPAGLYAADILLSKGINVVIYEATGQIGGRVRSLRNQENLPYQSIADFPVELGAEYWQGSDSVFGKIVGNLNLTTVELLEEWKRYKIGTTVKSAADWAGNGDFTSAQSFISGIKNYSGAATSVKEASAGLSEGAQALINAQAANFYGSSSDRVGIKGISDQMKLLTHGTEYFMLKNNTMQDLVISRFDNVYKKVEINRPVKSVNYGASPVNITFEDGSEVTADKVIVTVPVTILKNGITFTPALPAAKTTALGRIGMDPAIRVVLDFKKNFWGTDVSMIFGGTVAPQCFNAGVGRSEFNQTLSMMINGPKALELSNLNNSDQVVTTILQELDKVYANQATAFIRKALPPDEQKMVYFIQDWTKEKYFQGGFSYPLASTTIDDRSALGAPIQDRLFFAGEATDIGGDAGTINGAMASAERVANDVVLSITKVS